MFNILIYITAGLGAGIGTGLAGLSAAAVISPMLITFCGFDPYEAVCISLASDVLASAAGACTYGKNKNPDIKNGLVMPVSVLILTVTDKLRRLPRPKQYYGRIFRIHDPYSRY